MIAQTLTNPKRTDPYRTPCLKEAPHFSASTVGDGKYYYYYYKSVYLRCFAARFLTATEVAALAVAVTANEVAKQVANNSSK